jgi:hypothetical protein
MLREDEDGRDTFQWAFIARVNAHWQLQPLCCSQPGFTDQSLLGRASSLCQAQIHQCH